MDSKILVVMICNLFFRWYYWCFFLSYLCAYLASRRRGLCDKKSRTKKCWSARSSEAAAFIGHSPGTCLPFDLMRNKEWKGLKLKSFITIIYSTSYLFRTTQTQSILRFLQAIAEKTHLYFFDNLAPGQFGTNIVVYYPSFPLLTLIAKLSYR